MVEATSEAAVEEHVHHPNYTRIYVVLLVLLAVSIAGPMLEIRVVTLITAFGIALVKAYLVVKNFMHIDVARRYVVYLVTTCLVFMLLLFAGTAPDVMKGEGDNWVKPGWGEVAHREAAAPHGEAAPGHGSGEH